MGYKNELYLVRHGEYGEDYSLNAKGREIDGPAARDQLIAYGLGASAIILSSNAPRAAETAEIIGYGLGANPVMSDLIRVTGNNAWNVEDLDAVVEDALNQAGVEIDAALQDLIVVTHAPMLAIARGVESSDIGYGEVLKYVRYSWNNPHRVK